MKKIFGERASISYTLSQDDLDPLFELKINWMSQCKFCKKDAYHQSEISYCSNDFSELEDAKCNCKHCLDEKVVNLITEKGGRNIELSEGCVIWKFPCKICGRNFKQSSKILSTGKDDSEIRKICHRCFEEKICNYVKSRGGFNLWTLRYEECLRLYFNNQCNTCGNFDIFFESKYIESLKIIKKFIIYRCRSCFEKEVITFIQKTEGKNIKLEQKYNIYSLEARWRNLCTICGYNHASNFFKFKNKDSILCNTKTICYRCQKYYGISEVVKVISRNGAINIRMLEEHVLYWKIPCKTCGEYFEQYTDQYTDSGKHLLSKVNKKLKQKICGSCAKEVSNIIEIF